MVFAVDETELYTCTGTFDVILSQTKWYHSMQSLIWGTSLLDVRMYVSGFAYFTNSTGIWLWFRKPVPYMNVVCNRATLIRKQGRRLENVTVCAIPNLDGGLKFLDLLLCYYLKLSIIRNITIKIIELHGASVFYSYIHLTE